MNLSFLPTVFEELRREDNIDLVNISLALRRKLELRKYRFLILLATL